jgi:uncharacterized repeat protein (TIGR01451 family)
MRHFRLALRGWIGAVAALLLLSRPAVSDDDKSGNHGAGDPVITSAIADQEQAVPAWSQSSEEVPPAERVAPTPARRVPGAQARPRPEAPLPAAVVLDSGPLVTHPGGGAGGVDASRLQNSSLLMSSLGFTASTATVYRIADDFTVPSSGWSINTITFFAYQTSSTTTSTFNDVRVQIWNGDSVIFGDTTTNRFSSTAFSNIYRDTETSVANNQRPIMRITANVPLVLAAGTYWVDFQLGGTLASGPFVPPTTVLGQTRGCSQPCNAVQWNGAAWAYLTDSGSGIQQDVRFTIDANEVDLSITKTDGQATAILGQPITYTIVASNAGPSAATGATVVDTLPGTITGATWTCAGAGGGTCTASGSGNINQTVNLPVGGSVTFSLAGTINLFATGSLSNTATVAAPAGFGDPNLANNSATDTDILLLPADLSITKTDGQTAAVPGQPVTYTIVASNAGPNAATGATVVDTLPEEITGATWTCAGAGGGICAASGSGNINDTVNLPVGGTVAYSLTGTIDASARGSLGNTATVAAPAGIGDPNLANNSATDTDVLPGVDYFTLAPCRVVDTRGGAPIGGPVLQGQETRVFTVANICGIPTTAKAISLNLTVTQPGAVGHVRLFPAGQALPTISSINYAAGQTRANNAVIKLNASGAMSAFIAQAAGTTVHLIIDVNGYFQ